MDVRCLTGQILFKKNNTHTYTQKDPKIQTIKKKKGGGEESSTNL